MTDDYYLSLSSEINVLKSLISEIPQQNVIERLGFEARLKLAQAALERTHQLNQTELDLVQHIKHWIDIALSFITVSGIGMLTWLDAELPLMTQWATFISALLASMWWIYRFYTVLKKIRNIKD